jgi:hypothetical protein
MVSSPAQTVAQYLDSLPPERKQDVSAVRAVIRKNLPRGFAETMQYGMIGYAVPLSRHPETYNGRPLCLAGLAAQKNHMSLYLMSIYGDPELRRWFETAWKASGKKLDIGKACIRFRKLDDLPLELIGRAVAKVSVQRFIDQYETARGRTRPAKGKAPRKALARKAPARKAPA